MDILDALRKEVLELAAKSNVFYLAPAKRILQQVISGGGYELNEDLDATTASFLRGNYDLHPLFLNYYKGICLEAKEIASELGRYEFYTDVYRLFTSSGCVDIYHEANADLAVHLFYFQSEWVATIRERSFFSVHGYRMPLKSVFELTTFIDNLAYVQEVDAALALITDEVKKTFSLSTIIDQLLGRLRLGGGGFDLLWYNDNDADLSFNCANGFVKLNLKQKEKVDCYETEIKELRYLKL